MITSNLAGKSQERISFLDEEFYFFESINNLNLLIII